MPVIKAWEMPDPKITAGALQRTLFDVALGIQTVQGYVMREQIYQALERYGYDQRCGDCHFTVEGTISALEQRGNLESFETYFQVK